MVWDTIRRRDRADELGIERVRCARCGWCGWSEDQRCARCDAADEEKYGNDNDNDNKEVIK